MLDNFPLPVLGFAAWSGTGKTTLLTKLIPLLKAQGLRVVIIKHAHHNFEIDKPGKDSYRFNKAGASQVVVASNKCIASIRMIEDNEDEPRLEDALNALHTSQVDLVLVEGFKHAAIPKIELHRQSLQKPYLYPRDKLIIALAENTKKESGANEESRDIPRLDINKPIEIVSFIQQWLSVSEEAL